MDAILELVKFLRRDAKARTLAVYGAEEVSRPG